MQELPLDLGIDDATDVQLKELFSHFVLDITSRKAKGPMERLLKVVMYPQ